MCASVYIYVYVCGLTLITRELRRAYSEDRIRPVMLILSFAATSHAHYRILASEGSVQSRMHDGCMETIPYVHGARFRTQTPQA